MNNFFKALAITIIAALGPTSYSSSQNGETITIVTYYPSPSGSYDQIGVNKLSVDVNALATPTEYTAMRNGDMHIGYSLIVGPDYSYAQLNRTVNNRPAYGGVLISGPIGIGTTRPQAGVHIRGNESTNTSAIFVESTDRASMYSFLVLGGDTALNIRDARNNNTNRLIVSYGNTPGFVAVNGTTGNVGIGISNPQVKLDINGGILLWNDAVCNSFKAGTLMYNTTFSPQRIEYCDGTSWKVVVNKPSYGWVQAPGNATLNSTPLGSFLEWRSGGDLSPNKICQNAGFTRSTSACQTPLGGSGTIAHGYLVSDDWGNYSFATNAGSRYWRLGCFIMGYSADTNPQTKIMCVK